MLYNNKYKLILRNMIINKTRKENCVAETRYEKIYAYRCVSHLACTVGLSVKCVPLRLSVRDTFRSSRSLYVIGNEGGIFILRARLRSSR